MQGRGAGEIMGSIEHPFLSPLPILHLYLCLTFTRTYSVFDAVQSGRMEQHLGNPTSTPVITVITKYTVKHDACKIFQFHVGMIPEVFIQAVRKEGCKRKKNMLNGKKNCLGAIIATWLSNTLNWY